MEFKLLLLLHVCILLSVALMATHAASPGEAYWNKVLPRTPMPKALEDLLSMDWEEDKSTSVSVGKGGVNVNTGKGKPGGGGGGGSGGSTHVNVGHKGGVAVSAPGTNVHVGGKGGVGVTAPGTNVHVGRKGGVGVSAGKPGKGTNVGVGKGGVTVRSRRKGKPVYVGVKPGANPFVYNYAASETQLHDNPDTAVFFLEKDLHEGEKMNLRFVTAGSETTPPATFLPRLVSDKIPFSSSKLETILEKFSVQPGTAEADAMEKTLRECEDPGVAGEEKYCATSLESMVDYSTGKLGREVQAISTEAGGGEDARHLKQYTISGVKKMGVGEGAVACHRQSYAYAVFYCHKTVSTEAYVVSLRGKGGGKAEAVAVCHKDTSGWNPKHLAFQVLKVKPGSVPVCHFLPQDHILWIPKN